MSGALLLSVDDPGPQYSTIGCWWKIRSSCCTRIGFWAELKGISMVGGVDNIQQTDYYGNYRGNW